MNDEPLDQPLVKKRKKNKKRRKIQSIENSIPQQIADSSVQNQLGERIEKLENLGKVQVAPSCEHWAMHGATQNGEYPVDPDGIMYGSKPFFAFCDFTKNETHWLHFPH